MTTEERLTKIETEQARLLSDYQALEKNLLALIQAVAPDAIPSHVTIPDQVTHAIARMKGRRKKIPE